MKQKGSTKRVENVNFWGRYKNQVSEELKNMIYEQYLGHDLHIYCDSSLNKTTNQMSVACCYVGFGQIFVKQQYVYQPKDCTTKNIYGEIKAILFGLTHFEKYKMPGCKKVVFYSDVDDIEGFLHNEINFKRNESLKKLQSELILHYQKVRRTNPNIEIDVKYLKKKRKAV
ncbi:TPA: hypothetical protein G9C53_004984 [Salmonella enterica subsp. enterica serovar Typhimurium var. 5-]|uniref:RNase H type-1 domain-containing protein n=1 Tax=Salmonella enterica subsp. enterica serovar Typhimurium var. 5- TaxID=1620419 RepID=A0A740TKN6_SALTM|nr:hypothetical protein [Salmonella enterica subsp. enterica serovar Typhimurium var. 5-]